MKTSDKYNFALVQFNVSKNIIVILILEPTSGALFRIAMLIQNLV